MALMDRETHENLLNELLSEELTVERKTEILQELRADNVAGNEEFATLTQTNEKLSSEKDDLILSHSKMFRQLGTVGDESKAKENEEKEFSETVTISELEETAEIQ